jgi:hypothetical protein
MSETEFALEVWQFFLVLSGVMALVAVVLFRFKSPKLAWKAVTFSALCMAAVIWYGAGLDEGNEPWVFAAVLAAVFVLVGVIESRLTRGD